LLTFSHLFISIFSRVQYSILLSLLHLFYWYLSSSWTLYMLNKSLRCVKLGTTKTWTIGFSSWFFYEIFFSTKSFRNMILKAAIIIYLISRMAKKCFLSSELTTIFFTFTFFTLGTWILMNFFQLFFRRIISFYGRRIFLLWIDRNGVLMILVKY